jgi:hypothetical protein
MDEDDQNSLAGFDLDAWAPPAVAQNFANRVIARVAATDQAIAVEVNRRSTRRWWYGTAIAAILAAAAAILVWQMPGQAEPQSPESGSLLAIRPQQRLVLDHASGVLDVGAFVTWSHVGGVVTVAQRTGGATWHVDANQRLKINLGAEAANAVTSIEATDATLRLETTMNLADGKILGAAAITAVSLITLIVVKGHVVATNDDQTLIVPSGGVLALRDNHAITWSIGEAFVDAEHPGVIVTMGEPRTVGKRVIVPQTARGDFAEVLLEPGESPKIHDLAATVSVAIKLPTCDHDTVETAFETSRVLEHDPYFNVILPRGVFPYTVRCAHGANFDRGVINVVADEGLSLAGTPPGVNRNVVPDVTATRYESDSMGLHFLIKRTPKVVSHLPKQLDQNDIRMVMKTAESTLMGRCAIKSKMHLAFTVLPSGKVDGLTVTSTDKTGAECIKGIVTGMLFPKAQTEVAVTYPISPAPACDADNLVETGTQAEGRGEHAHALDELKKAYACKPEAHTLALAFMAACNAGKVPDARKFWKLMLVDQQSHLELICTHNHITREMLDAK